MDRNTRTSTRLIAVFLLGALLFNYPVLAVFSRPVEVAGIPLLYAYLFAAWTLLVALLAWVVTRGR
jgi:hypothetical protein